MIHPEAQQVFLIADYFSSLAHSLGSYIDINKGNLSDEQRNCLYNAQLEISTFSGTINMIGVELVFEDLHQSLSILEEITKKVDEAVEKALSVQKAIDIATSIVLIGNAIIAKDPRSIVTTTIQAVKILNSDK